MDEQKLRSLLPVDGLGLPLHVFESIGSSNDISLELARAGAPHGTLVVADEQLAGRGRGERKWITRPGSALAMTILIRPGTEAASLPGYFTFVGSLAVLEALAELGAQVAIKWPNDVVVQAGKLAGLLGEASWSGEKIDFVVLGIGVNITRGAIPAIEEIDFPAACVEDVLGEGVDREALIAAILKKMAAELAQPDVHKLVERIESHLAYRDQELEIESGDRKFSGRIAGLREDGILRIILPGGKMEELGIAAHIRPVDFSIV